MMDAVTAPRIPVTDGASSQAAGGRADKYGEGGFSEALSTSGRQDRGESQAGSTEAEAGAEQADEAATPDAARSKRPIIDISQASLLKSASEAVENTVAEEFGQGRTAEVKDKNKGKTKDAGAAETKTTAVDGHQMAAALQNAGVKGTAASGGKTTEIDGEAVAGEESVSVDGKTADLGDVLSLLTSGPVAEGVKDPAHSRDAIESVKTEQDGRGNLLVEGLSSHGVAADDAEAPSGDGAEATDQAFRFVRADGKGQSVTLRSEASQALREDNEAVTTNVETVTVLDARRYLAPVSGSNGASITAAMLGDSEWISAMSPGSELANAATQSSQGKVVNTLKIQMSPIELGSVTATLKLTGDELSVQLTVENHAALQKLTKDQDDILKALRAQGLTVDQVQVNIQVSASDRSADSGQSNSNGQQNGQASGQQASYQSDGQAGSERQARGGSGDMARTADERTIQQTGGQAAGDDNTRPDLIYV